MPAPIPIDQRALFAQLSVAEPVLKKEAERIMRKEIFEPAVGQMMEEFESHEVTREIDAGINAQNISETLSGDFKDDKQKNLFSFIGFESGDSPTDPIRERLDPSHPNGPKLVYKGMDKNKMQIRFEVRAPNEGSIYDSTPLPWATGLSWAKRIEVGIAGLGKFLNRKGLKQSRSGGGIQVENQLRPARFIPTKYLSQIFKNFLQNVSGTKYSSLQRGGKIFDSKKK